MTFSEDKLSELTRRELQSLAKEHGVKANKRSAEIIELLLKLNIAGSENSQNVGNLPSVNCNRVSKENESLERLLTIVANSNGSCLSYSSLKRIPTLKHLGEELRVILLQAVDSKYLVCTEIETNSRQDELGFRITTIGRETLRRFNVKASGETKVCPNELRKALAHARISRKKKSDEWHVVESKTKPGKFFKYDTQTKSSVWLN